MPRDLGLVKHFLLVAAPAIATLIASVPVQAATLASSEAKFQLGNFSINPTNIFTGAGTFTKTISPSGIGGATADATAEANFRKFDDVEKTFANNTSFSKVTGKRADDVAYAESIAGVIGYNFLVPKGGTFSFDFSGFLHLLTSIDNPVEESAVSEGLVSLMLYNNKDGSLLDSISLEGKIATPNNGDFITYKNAGSFRSANALTQNSFGGNEEFARTDVSGRYSRMFDSETSLTLVEFKSNRAAVAVPENTNSTIFLIAGGIILMVTKIRRRHTINNL
ncbi:PEP motif putative anchor domain protein [Calothrix sp. NIES-4071]|nr:PEP motif putative anchor domain protein [Calothrix sp. NIES-4071]BAZ61786.1 PEP motif putative anchor domain protein [Calothrix sp. NIES-4105]